MRWGVVATVREPVSLVVGFACHHLALGAASVHLFFDLPDDPAAEIAEGIAGVKVTRCTSDHWRSFGFRKPPGIQTKKQTLNANRVRQTSDLDWLLHADADEFLWLPKPLQAEWAAMPDEARWLHIPNIERCWTQAYGRDMFEGVFRAGLHDRPALAEAVYAKRARALSGGLGGYSAGKAMARQGDGFLAIHKLRAAEGGPVLPRHSATEARILHFDGITPRHWGLKNLRYAAQGAAMNQLLNPERMATIGAILRAPDPERAALRVHEALYRLDPSQTATLEAEGRLFRPTIDIPGAVAQIAPHLAMDFSSAGFDRPHQRELSARAQTIVRQKRRAKRRDGA